MEKGKVAVDTVARRWKMRLKMLKMVMMMTTTTTTTMVMMMMMMMVVAEKASVNDFGRRVPSAENYCCK